MDVCLPETASVGTLQNMQCTVTVVERYQVFDIYILISLICFGTVYRSILFFMEVIL